MRTRALTWLVAAALVAASAVEGAPSAAAAAPPPVTAPQAILLEPTTGHVLFARQAQRRRPVASATKLMTALVVLERVSLDEVFTSTHYRSISPAETRLGLRGGERIAVRDLLRAVLLASSNDAAETLAVRTAGSREHFVALMNDRARQLGLADTHFANPIGLDDPANYSSAADLVRLTAHLRNFPFFTQTIALSRVRLTSGQRPRTVENRNHLVGSHPHVNGVKTGHTLAAGYVLVGSATRGGVTVLSAVLGDPSEAARDADTAALLDHGLRELRRVTVLRPRQRVGWASVVHGGDRRVRLVAGRAAARILPHSQRAAWTLRAPRELEGPLPAGARVGIALVHAGGRVVDRVPVLTASAVPEVGLLERAVSAVLQPVPLILLGVGAATAWFAAAAARRRPPSASARRASSA